MAVKNNYSRRKQIKIPEPSEQLAEFIGIFLGDGSFGNNYQLVISWNHKCEHDYAKHVQRMVRSLFGIESKIRIRKKYGSAEIVISSSNLVDHVRKLTGIKLGGAKKSFKLPAWLSRNKKYRVGFLRGLFDSEGCVYRHKYYSNAKPYSYVKIAVTNYCDEILSVFQEFLRSAGINSVKYRNRVHIYSDADTRRFFSLIGTSNIKNRVRFIEFSH
jgi:intein/homing endonuclease